MIRHVVLMRFKPGTTPEQVEAVREGLLGLRDQIPQIVDYTCGADLGFVEGNHAFALDATFADHDDWLTYRTHPAHLAVIDERITPIAAERVAVQYELP